MPSLGRRKSALSVSLRICCEKSDPIFKKNETRQACKEEKHVMCNRARGDKSM